MAVHPALLLSLFVTQSFARRTERLIDSWRPANYHVSLTFNDRREVGGSVEERGVSPERVDEAEEEVVLGLPLGEEAADAPEELVRVVEPLQAQRHPRRKPHSACGNS